MKLLPDWLTSGYLRLINPVADWLVRHDVQPNTITTIGTLCSITGGIIYGAGHIKIGGWFLGVTALFDVLDGVVARRTNRSSVFGAFYDSTLDRVADGFVLLSVPQAYSGLAVSGGVLSAIISVLTVTAWITAAQRIYAVYRAARRE